MACDFLQQANTGVQSLSPYSPGKPISELERELGLSNIIKLASNENPLGCSELAIKAAKTCLQEIALYPDGNGFALKKALCEHLKSEKLALGLDQFILGNGSNDILELVARAFLNEDSEAIFSEYAFAVYPLAVQAVGAKAVVAPVKEWGHDLERMANLITKKTKVIFIANPNNPTGTWLTKTEILGFLEKVPSEVLVVLDEAYFEYVTQEEYPNGIELLKSFENLLVTRTFSKAYGLAGMRVGYGVASATIIDILNRIRQPFNVNSIALAAAEQSLLDPAFIERSVESNQAGLNYFESELMKRDLSYISSVANFISIDFGKAAQKINDELLEAGLIVRPLASYQMPDFLRVTIGTSAENESFFSALDNII